MLNVNTTSHDLELYVDLLFTWDSSNDDGTAIWSTRAVDTQDCHEEASLAYNLNPTLKKMSSDANPRRFKPIYYVPFLASDANSRAFNLFYSFVPLLICLLLQVGGSLSAPDVPVQEEGQTQHMRPDDAQSAYYTPYQGTVENIMIHGKLPNSSPRTSYHTDVDLRIDDTQSAYSTQYHGTVENIMIHGKLPNSAPHTSYQTDVELQNFEPAAINTETCDSFTADLVKLFGEAKYAIAFPNASGAVWELKGAQFESLCFDPTVWPIVAGRIVLVGLGPGCEYKDRRAAGGEEPDASDASLVTWMKGPRMTAEERTFLYPPIFLIAGCLLWEHGFGE